MKKVCFIMHRFAGGGAEKVTILLANELVKKGYGVSFFVKHYDGELKEDVDEKINVIELKKGHIGYFASLYKSLKKTSFDTVFCVSMGLSVYAILINKLLSNRNNLYPVIHCAMSKAEETVLDLKCTIFRVLQQSFCQAIVVSEEARQDFLKITKLPENKTLTIYNPVVSDKIIDLSKEKNNHRWIVKHSAPLIVSAGRLTKQKNFKLLLDSISIILNVQKVHCIILGQGELEQELKQYACKLNISEYVDFYGFTNNPYSFFRNADCYVLSSSWEGLPTVLIEAMVCGCPIVSTDCVSGPKEILVNGEYGKLVPEDDSKALANAIIYVLQNKISTRNLLNRSNDFTVDKAVCKYLKIIER